MQAENFTELSPEAIGLLNRLQTDVGFYITTIVDNNPQAVAANLKEMGFYNPESASPELIASILYQMMKSGNTAEVNTALDVPLNFTEDSALNDALFAYSGGYDVEAPKTQKSIVGIIGDVLATGADALGGNSYIGGNAPPPTPPPAPPKKDYTALILGGIAAIILVIVLIFYFRKP